MIGGGGGGEEEEEGGGRQYVQVHCALHGFRYCLCCSCSMALRQYGFNMEGWSQSLARVRIAGAVWVFSGLVDFIDIMVIR